MTTQHKHTLLPWKHEPGTPFIIRDSGLIIADFFNDKCPLPENPFGVGEANAAFAALACNSHYELVEAVKEARWLGGHIMGKEKRINWGDTFDIDFGRMNEVFLKFDAAIAAATGQEVA